MKNKIINLLSVCALLVSFSNLSQANAQEPTPACCPKGCAEYGSFYTKTQQTVRPKHPIIFDKETIKAKGIHQTQDNGGFKITVPGVYRITYSVALDDECEGSYWHAPSHKNVALTINDHVIRGSEMHIEKKEHLSTLSVIIKVCNTTCAKNIVQLINNNEHDGHHNEIKLKSGCDHKNVTASIEFEKLAVCCDPCSCQTDGDKD